MKYHKSFERHGIRIELFTDFIGGGREWKARSSRIALLVHCHGNFLRLILRNWHVLLG